MQFAVIVCLCGGALATVGFAHGRSVPTGPRASAAVAAGAPSLSQSPRSGDLHITKECGDYQGNAGDFCTITSSNVRGIDVGSKVVYGEALGATSLDSDVVLDPPGPGNNKAFGHCALNLLTGLGVCTFSGGTGQFRHFDATAQVSYLGGFDWAWDGTYSVSPPN